jgi:hypothetical protein
MEGGSMSQYELLDLAQSALSNSTASYAIFLSIVSGYLITAYLVGSELTRAQVSLLTTLFLIVTALATWAMCAFNYWADQYSTMARGEGVASTIMSTQPFIPIMLAAINILTVAACLFFMRNIRHRSE